MTTVGWTQELGDIAADFDADTPTGPLNLYKYLDGYATRFISAASHGLGVAWFRVH
jgi:hypothetical protein